ncbi:MULTISPECIES: hypothetical protein [Bacillus]|uniref:hypothetical protein n=1 Tax=Bacillus TaxID=1386 RepID=UPI001E589C4D|nr:MULTISPECIES: hypothetical protein [Bacillus]
MPVFLFECKVVRYYKNTFDYTETNKNMNATELIQRLRAEHVLMKPIYKNYLSNFYKENSIKIDARNINAPLISTGIQTIVQIISRMRM